LLLFLQKKKTFPPYPAVLPRNGRSGIRAANPSPNAAQTAAARKISDSP
jgi:hypothetical protein